MERDRQREVEMGQTERGRQRYGERDRKNERQKKRVKDRE